MPVFSRLKKFLLKNLFGSIDQKEPKDAYNLWAPTYDNQPDNLMLALDEVIFASLINNFIIKDKIIADVGCGTGRHWKRIVQESPRKLIGYDVSEKMISILHQKFPEAQTYRLTSNRLPGLEPSSCDLVISTLSIAHIENLEEAFREWSRVLKPAGEIIITDYHPDALENGADRTFRLMDKLIYIRNYIHPVKEINQIAGQLHWIVLRFIEKTIDDTVKPYYERHKALPVFERFKGIPIIYGIHLKKADATA